MIFLYLGIFMMLLSLVASLFKMSAVHPVTGEALVVQNLISGFGLTKILTSAVSGFTGFAPLGVVLVCMLGVGLCEKSGLLQIAIKHGLGNVKGSPLKVMVILIMLSILFDILITGQKSSCRHDACICISSRSIWRKLYTYIS
ncbi:MAG: transporter [Sedimentibacter sp.]|nr:transporter [Sedimentibacter sp.]